ncbi:hypothetical protein AB0F96_20830 [Streptomyces sp. NPDC023998]|uniref:hypothetical protein n=1 Tax=Streptomyces sp. NPDC023998 TaxID=3154597 RepID=UPI0033F77D0B
MVRSVLAHHLHRRFSAPMRRFCAPMRQTAGVHSVYLTACCAVGNSSVSITEFNFG